MASLAEIRARLQAADTKGNSNQGGGDRAIYPHWNMEEGQSATLRFLPDGNTKNTFFWVERTWFKDKSLEDMGRKYWKKRSYLFQGFVRENPISEDKTPDNPIRKFIIGPQLFTLIKGALMDPELEELPTDLMRGLDFRITKTQKGGFADYNSSKWARKESALTEAEQAAIETHSLHDLSTFLPKRPGDVELKVIKEMFEASVDGQPYDTERWGQYFRPAGVAAPGGAAAGDAEDTPAPAAKPALKVAVPAAPVAEDAFDEEPAAPAAPVTAAKPSGNAQDILAMIRARQNKQ
jgi:hypothetical protein